MFDSTKVINGMKNLIGFRNHYDLTEIPTLDVDLTTSESGEYIQDKHPALRLDILKSIIPENRDFEQFLTEKRDSAIVELLGDICSQKRYGEYARKTLVNQNLIDRYGWLKDTIINQNRFVGVKFRLKQSVGISAVIKKIGIQVTEPQILKLYVYHSSKMEAVTTIDLQIGQGVQWNWKEVELQLSAETKDIQGGVYIIGYYQSDLVGQAINYSGLHWITGPCATCDGGISSDKYRNVSKYLELRPIYVPANSLNGTHMFDLDDSFELLTENFGLNFNLSIECDLSDFFIEHRFSMKKALGLKLSHILLKEIMFTQNINYIEENLRSLIIRDLEGDKETNYVNIADQLAMEIKAVNFDHSKLSEACLPCNSKRGVNYGVA